MILRDNFGTIKLAKEYKYSQFNMTHLNSLNNDVHIELRFFNGSKRI